jgi:hypothetical protein
LKNCSSLVLTWILFLRLILWVRLCDVHMILKLKIRIENNSTPPLWCLYDIEIKN